MLHRRQFLGGSLSGFFAFAARNRLANLFSDMRPADLKGAAKRCVVLWMEGGPSQLDTFDPKPDTATGGPIEKIKTSVTGIDISSYLPEVSKQMQHLSVIRNLTSSEGEHIRASQFMHTGFKFVPTFPRPSMGSVVSKHTEFKDFPNYVSLGSPGFGPAFMGPEHAPFSISDLGEAKNLIDQVGKRASRLELLDQLDVVFTNKFQDRRVQQRRANLEKIQNLARTGFGAALDVNKISSRDQIRYGDSKFGRQCLVARKLLDLGVSFVEVQLEGWDTHERNFQSVERLCGILDRPMAALVQDLKTSGIYDDTIIIWMGEFGRTPTINSRGGRDHFPQTTPVVIGGGPFNNGQVIGETNQSGTQIVGPSYSVADLFATVYKVFGIEPDAEFTTDFDSPTSATDGGKVISELI